MSIFTHQAGQYLHVAGARLYFEQQGNPQGPPLVLLHGGLGDVSTFNALAPSLGRVYHLIGIDSRGQGRSTLGPEPLTYQRLSDDVEAILQHLTLARVNVIGHSDGGIAALRLAASGALHVDKLVTIGAHWALGADDPTRSMYEGITADAWREMFPESVQSYMAMNPEPDFDRLVAAVRRLWLDSSATGYPEERVREITASLLVVRGDQDPLVSRRNAIELIERVPGAALLNLPMADHSPHEDRAPWLLPILEAFLAAPPAHAESRPLA